MHRTVAPLLLVAALVGAVLLVYDSAPDTTDVDTGDEATEGGERRGPELVARGTRPQSRKPGTGEETAARKPGAEEVAVAPPPATVIRYRGRVVDEQGRPISGATVILRGSGLEPIRVNADGTFEVEVPAGRYDLVVRTDDGRVLSQENLTIGGDLPELVTLTVVEGPSLVVVVQRDGEPARNVEVALTSVSDRNVGRLERALLRAQTLRGGRAVVGKPPKGVYEILLTFMDGLKSRRPYEHAADQVVLFDIGAAVAVKGRVTEGAGGPGIRGATVRLGGDRRSDRAWFTVEAQTDAEGAFAMEAPKATYRDVHVSAEGYSPWQPHGGTREERKKRAPILQALRNVGTGKPADVTIPLLAASGIVLRGQVRDLEKNPVEGTEVRIVPGSRRVDDPEIVVPTGANGVFEATGLRPGGYQALVITNEWINHRRPTFVIEEGDERKDILVVVIPAGGLHGRVVKSDGSAVAGARVWLDKSWPIDERQPEEPAPHEVFTGSDGRWRIGALHPRSPWVVHAAWGGLRSEPVKAAPYREGLEDLELKLEPAVTLRVQVIERGTTNGVQGARVKFVPEPEYGRPQFQMFSDDDGRFELEDVLPAKWKVKPWSWWHLEHDEEVVDLTGKAGVVEVTIEMDPGLAIAGRVHDDRGEPLAATIKISGVDGDNRKIWRELTADGDGLFRATGFRQGSYVLTAKADGHTQAVQRELKGGEEHLDLKLIPLPAKK